MRPLSRCGTALLAVITLCGPSAAEDVLDPSPAAVREALGRARADPDRRGSLQLAVECSQDGRLPSVEVFGRGVGIWEGRRQFTLPPAEVASLLTALQKSDFANLKPVYGGPSRPAAPGREKPHAAPATKVTCRIGLSLEGLSKEVAQLDEGEQSAALRQLAEAVFRICEPHARSGVEAKDLSDGLAKISRGELAPEALAVMLHRKPELNAAEAQGFLLRVRGRTARTQAYTRSSGYGTPLELDLGTAGLEALAGELAGKTIARLPENLYAPDYNDLSIEVLNQRASVQARRFTGMTPTTHGERQTDFDALLATLSRLQERVTRDGRPVAGE